MPKFQLVLIVAAVVALVGLDYLHAAWPVPTDNPPKGNIATPINTSDNNQTKTGGLGAGSLSITGESQFNGTVKFPFKNTSAGALTEWNMQRNDGTGNFNIYLNSSGGNSPTYLTTGYALKELFNPGNGSYIFLGSGSSGGAGSTVSWQNLFRIFPDGRVGADQYCDIDGNNCDSGGGGLMDITFPEDTTCTGDFFSRGYEYTMNLSPIGLRLNSSGKISMEYRGHIRFSSTLAASCTRQYDPRKSVFGSCSCRTEDSSREFEGCFIAGTQVTMADGSKKNIEDVKIGEKLLGEGGAINTVLEYGRPMLGDRQLYSINEGPYFVTAEHPFRTTEGWKSIDPEALKAEKPKLYEELSPIKLSVGDEILRDDGTVETVESITARSDVDQQLYNFELSGNKTYYANGYLVHNKPEDL